LLCKLEDLERKLQTEEDAVNDSMSEHEKMIAEARIMAIREEIENVKAQMRNLHP
jgi:anti-sigma28 factor (negative regulator of flagellin synthesis)